MEKIKNFAKTEAFTYLVFGVLTTLVYYVLCSQAFTCLITLE